MMAGYGEKVITPQLLGPMAGYDSREENAKGIHDDLYARCLILKIEKKAVVLISLDVLGVDECLIEMIKSAIMAVDREVEKEGIFVCATHTHSGPSAIFSNKVTFDLNYVNFVTLQCREAFLEAMNDIKEASIYHGTKDIFGIASKRNIYDPQKSQEGIKCKFLKIEKNDREIMVINFPCHLTVLDEGNFYYSKDLVYGLELELKENGNNKFLFINGAAGDISTRFCKKDASFEETERLGRLLAREILKEKTEMHKIDSLQPFTVKETSFLIKYKGNLSEEEKKAKKAQIEDLLTQIKDKRARRDLESALLVLNRPNRDFSKIPGVLKLEEGFFKRIKMSLAIMGQLVFIGVPFEIYYSTGIKIENILERKYRHSIVLIFGYCGGYEGYIPPAENFSQISYEVIASLFEMDAEKKLLEAIEKMVTEIGGENL